MEHLLHYSKRGELNTATESSLLHHTPFTWLPLLLTFGIGNMHASCQEAYNKCGKTCLYCWKVSLSNSLLYLEESQFQYVTVIIYSLYRILNHIFLFTVLTRSLPYNGLQQYVGNRCMVCYVH